MGLQEIIKKEIFENGRKPKRMARNDHPRDS